MNLYLNIYLFDNYNNKYNCAIYNILLKNKKIYTIIQLC